MVVNRRNLLGGLFGIGAAAGFSAPGRAEKACLPQTYPVPKTASPQLRALITERTSANSRVWKLRPKTAKEWHAIVNGSAAEIEKKDAAWPDKYGVTVREDRIGGVPVYWVAPKHLSGRNRERLLLNFHGGAYVYAPGRAGLEDAILMASRGFRVVSVDYRMAPDFPYPAAIDDAAAVWRVLAQRHDPKHVGVFGTSTGGGMTLALIHRCKKTKLALPAALWAGTPWSDLTKTGDSYFTNDHVDTGLVSYDGILEAAAQAYAAGHDMRDPEISPIYGDFSGFPPTFLSSGTRDLFLSNTIRVHRKLRDAGVTTDLTVIEALSHADYVALPNSPESRQVYADAVAFFDRMLGV
jgi:epsilon-lactone hydrolase